MKSTVYGTVNKKVYFLGYEEKIDYKGNFIYLNEGKKLDVHSDSSDVGKIKSEIVFVEYTQLYETSKFQKLLTEGDLVVYAGNEYKIIKLAHEGDGDIRYYTNFVETYEDDKSKTIAEDEFAKRQVYLRGREDEQIKTTNEKIKQLFRGHPSGTIIPFETKKVKKNKWYKFWSK